MHGVTRRLSRSHGACHLETRFNPSSILQRARFFASISQAVPHLEAPDLSSAQNPDHIRIVSNQLRQNGILKIGLGFGDEGSNYLQKLIRGLHEHHGHQLPITHSASCGWFWDVRPNATTFQTRNHQARSETMKEFPWHTDCSYEEATPRFFALQVLQHDRYGGGTLSVLSVERLREFLSPATRSALLEPEYRITIPAEFIKNDNHQHIIGSILAAGEDGQSDTIRYRGEIITPISERASKALEELTRALEHLESSAIHLTPDVLPKGSIILLDNRRWLHARNGINDPERHLRRVRWDATPFTSLSK
ncbi:hypothetical protein N7475_004984 [Penicillium sp. IBT 31633x]|nr:hypothetical protein N7475_004984 [Penicillium sp. IBT 31633x]